MDYYKNITFWWNKDIWYIYQINQTQKNKTIDESIKVTNPINNNKTRRLQTADYES